MLKQVKQSVLIVVDVQNGFTPGGNLAVANADEIIPNINQLAQKFEHIVLTQDWHPDQHISFADNHPNKSPLRPLNWIMVAKYYGLNIVFKARMMLNFIPI
jgi:nicotinamidase/pyrazinamidase